MWIIQNSNNILSFLCFFCKQQCFCQRLHAFRVNTNDSNQRDSIKKKYCVKLLFKKISFSSVTEGNLIYFFKSFFVADHFRSNLRTFRCAKTEEEALCFEVVKHLLSQCFRVSVCVRASDNSAVYHFCYFGFKWKIKTLDKDVFVISFILLCYSRVGLEGLCDCYDVTYGCYLVENNRHCSFPCGDMNLIPSFIIKLITRHLPNYTSLQLQ